MKALVTGACGFVGSYLVNHLLTSNDKVVGTFLHGRPQLRCELTQLDVTDLPSCKSLVQKYQPEVIYHLAGMAFVPDAEKNFTKALDANVAGTHNIFRAALELKAKVRLVLVSSAQVYGRINPKDLPLKEDAALNPADNYSLSKAMSEMVAARFKTEKSVEAVIMRPFNHIGAGQRVEFAVSNFAYQLAEIAKKTRPAVIQVGNLEARRDFTDVIDIVKGYRLAAIKGQGAYNLCSGAAISMQSILDQLIETSGLQVKLEVDQARLRPSDTPDLYGNAEKARKELGWEPKVKLKDSLKAIYQHWLTSSYPNR